MIQADVKPLASTAKDTLAQMWRMFCANKRVRRRTGHTPFSWLPDLACALLQLASSVLHLVCINHLSATLCKRVCAAQAMALGSAHHHMLASLHNMQCTTSLLI